MKREFLQNFKVGDQPLPKETIDAIMAENGRDIQNAKKPFEDYDTIKGELETARATIQEFKDQDIEGIRNSAKNWEQKYNDAIAAHEKEKADMAFNHALESAITGAKGKNIGAVIGALGAEKVTTLKESKNKEADIKAALDSLKKDCGYLFDDGKIPPPYAGGTGTGNPNQTGEPMSLAGALREKYNIM